jgi:Dihaem cytochrome c
MNLPPLFRPSPTALRLLAWGSLLAAMTLGAATLSRADDDGDDDEHGKTPPHSSLAVSPTPAKSPTQGKGSALRTDPAGAAYKQECAACHLAYPPGMLPAASWQRLMNDLPHHFGTDASLEPAQVQAISRWLGAQAATTGRAAQQPPQDRITRSAWFVREHDELSAATFKRPAIKSAANCIACHTRADQGDFSERFIRIPR